MSAMFDLQIPPPPPAEVVQVRPAWDLTVGLIAATVQIDQLLPGGETRRVGTAFLVDAPDPDGLPRTVMVTAAHVLNGMAAPQARIGWRAAEADGGWRFAPEPLSIREADGEPRWTRHPDQDVAVMAVSAPPEFARAALPLGWLVEPEALDAWQVGPGDELMTLGYPHGYAANKAGFPILRTGRVASWPLTPVEAFPTFLLDFSVYPGNSGGPVFWTPAARKLPGTAQPEHPFIAGVLVQSMQVGGENVGIGIVAHARYVREAIALMDAAGP